MGSACTAPLTPLPEARPLGRDLATASAARTPPETPTAPFVEPEGVLSLQTALAAALRNSPRLEAFDWQVRADEARALQAGLLPNPTVGVEGENFAGSGEFNGYDTAETTVFLGQLVQLGGKRAKRRRVAMLDRELSGWDYEAARLDVLTETTQRFVAALAARERLALAGETLRVARESLEATRARVRAGAASSIEEARSEVSVATMEVEQTRREVELDATRKALASSWAGQPRFTTLRGQLDEVRPLPSLERISEALEENPDLARWASEVSRREAASDLARAGAIPDVTAGLGVRHFNDTDDAALVFGIEVPLPLFDRNQGARRAAQADANRARAMARATRLEVSRSLIASHSTALAAFENSRAFEERVLPQAKTAYERTQVAYRRGLFRLVDVLDSQRILFDARTEYVNALERYHTARAELERLTGTPLDELEGRRN
jgi:cobalt-zinc-cadmium efflux system outer membrane protein